jgi:hypothetical protein
LKKELFAVLKEQQDPRVLGNGDVFDNYVSPNGYKKNVKERIKKLKRAAKKKPSRSK